MGGLSKVTGGDGVGFECWCRWFYESFHPLPFHRNCPAAGNYRACDWLTVDHVSTEDERDITLRFCR